MPLEFEGLDDLIYESLSVKPLRRFACINLDSNPVALSVELQIIPMLRGRSKTIGIKSGIVGIAEKH
jgi:hypothetical protein